MFWYFIGSDSSDFSIPQIKMKELGGHYRRRLSYVLHQEREADFSRMFSSRDYKKLRRSPARGLYQIRSLISSEIFLCYSIRFSGRIGASDSLAGLNCRQASVNNYYDQRRNFYSKAFTVSGVTLFFAGIFFLFYFYRNLYFNLTPNVNVAGHVALLFASACILWVGMGVIYCGLGLGE